MPAFARLLRARVAVLLVSLVVALAPCAGTAAAVSPWAEVADPVFLRLDQRTLPHPAVYAVAQDDAGFLWIGTPAGLARYDGYEVRSYLPGPQHPGAPPGVFALLADGRGTLWIGTPSNGLVALDTANEGFRDWPVDPAGRKGPRSASVIALDAGPAGELWIGGDAGLDRFDPRRGEFEPISLVDGAQPRVEAILVDRAQTVWVGTVHGLFCRARGERSFHPFAPVALPGFDARTFFSLYEDSTGRLWIGSINAVFVLDAGRRLARTYTSGAAPSGLGPGEQWAIVEVTPGTFWIASYDGGISIVDDASGRVRRMAIDRANPGGLTPGDVWHFFRDRSGLVWVANGPGGLLAHNPANRGIYSLSSSDKQLGTGEIGARGVAAAPDGALWLGGADNVVRLDPRTGAAKVFPVPGSPSVQTLEGGAGGTLWIGTMKGLCRLSAGAAAVECPPGAFAALGRVFAVLDRGDTLWVGTGDGLFALDPRGVRMRRYRRDGTPSSLSNDFINVLYADREGGIWVGTANGLDRVDPRTGRVLRFVHDAHDPSSLGTGAISAIVGDRRGRIWVGAVGGPLDVLTPRSSGGFDGRRVGAAEGLPENVDGLAAGADGRLWASATSALVSIDPETLAVRLVGAAEGVQETEFWTRAVSAAADGTIFFAGTYAVTVIAPGASADWSYEPPVVATALRVGGRAVPVGRRDRPLELAAGSRDVSVEFAALDYSAPAALRYAYQLEGYRGGWTEVDAAHRVATWTNLPPGRYTLRVRGSNRLGRWSGSVLALELHALPAWYETWWFRVLLAVLLALGVAGFVRARTAVLRRRAERLEGVVAERTRELAQANAALEDLTVTDPLTGLRNRRYFLQRVEEDVALALRQRDDLVFFLVDLDHFKRVNDELGHAAGDRVLQQMRGRLEKVFRASDYVLRWGGEEFLAVARASRREEAPEIAARLRVSIAERPFELDGGQQLPKTASIGFAAFPFDRRAPAALSWERVVELADQALYLAKRDGRNAWVGLASTAATDPRALVRILADAPEQAVEACALEVVRALEPPAALAAPPG